MLPKSFSSILSQTLIPNVVVVYTFNLNLKHLICPDAGIIGWHRLLFSLFNIYVIRSIRPRLQNYKIFVFIAGRSNEARFINYIPAFSYTDDGDRNVGDDLVLIVVFLRR
jgi:hypothetical protein